MKKDNREKISSPGKQLNGSFFKKSFIYIFLCIIFIFAGFLLIYRYVTKSIYQPEFTAPSFVRSQPSVSGATPSVSGTTPSVPGATLSVPGATGVSEDIRLSNLENNVNNLQLSLRAVPQLIALELLHEVLEGHLPVETLILYLQKKPEPWATDILNTFSSIKEGKTYAQLQALLILPPSDQCLSSSSSPWGYVKNIIKSFVSIRKLNMEGKLEDIDKIQTALYAHDIKSALELFNKLPPEQQVQLSFWKQLAQDRLILETIKQKLLLELSGS